VADCSQEHHLTTPETVIVCETAGDARSVLSVSRRQLSWMGAALLIGMFAVTTVMPQNLRAGSDADAGSRGKTAPLTATLRVPGCVRQSTRPPDHSPLPVIQPRVVPSHTVDVAYSHASDSHAPEMGERSAGSDETPVVDTALHAPLQSDPVRQANVRQDPRMTRVSAVCGASGAQPGGVVQRDGLWEPFQQVHLPIPPQPSQRTDAKTTAVAEQPKGTVPASHVDETHGLGVANYERSAGVTPGASPSGVLDTLPLQAAVRSGSRSAPEYGPRGVQAQAPPSPIGQLAQRVFAESPPAGAAIQPMAPVHESNALTVTGLTPAANGTQNGPQQNRAVQDQESESVGSSQSDHATPIQTTAGGHSLPLFTYGQQSRLQTAGPVIGNVAPPPGTSGHRASAEQDGVHWIRPYLGRTSGYVDGSESALTQPLTSEAPPGFSAWWDELVTRQAGLAERTYRVDVSDLVRQALQYSPQVQALQAEPEVQRQIVQQEEAAFDWYAFMESKYDDLNGPVGNILQTGNADDRLQDRIFDSGAGLRRRTRKGGELEVAQRIGHQYNNSRFLLPNPQSTAELELSFRQPLLSKSGVVYNESQIVLARISANMSGDEVLTELQSHLYRVAEAYWQLYRARAEYFQRRKLVASAHGVLRTLQGRNAVDTIPRQILRAQAAVARAEARSQRAVTSIRNAESQLRLLVNDPMMLDGQPLELLPAEMPAMFTEPTSLRGALQTALVNRPDVSRAIRQMRASGVRLGISRNELLPRLDFLVTSYVAGLESDRRIARAMGAQFTESRPGYTVGLELEFPIGNRQARARVEQRKWELKRSINVFRATVETGLTEVEIAAREVETSFREMQGRYHAMIAEQNEASYLQDRFEVLPLSEDSPVLLLEDLLNSFERLADEESAFVQAQVQYALSIIQLRRATGVLLKSRYESPRISGANAEWMNERIDAAAGDAEPPTSRDERPVTPTPPVPAIPLDQSPQRPVPPSRPAFEDAAAAEPWQQNTALPPPVHSTSSSRYSGVGSWQQESRPAVTGHSWSSAPR
jgi:outer membrane protein TolC